MTAIRPRSIPAACHCFAMATWWAASESQGVARPTLRNTQPTRRQLQRRIWPYTRRARRRVRWQRCIAVRQSGFFNSARPGTSEGSFTGSFFIGPSASPGTPPEGMLVAPVAGPLGGLAASDVTQIINNAIATAKR